MESYCKMVFAGPKEQQLTGPHRGYDAMYKTWARSSQTNSQHRWGRGSQLPPLTEELLAIDGHWGRESIFLQSCDPTWDAQALANVHAWQHKANPVGLKRST